MTKIRKIRIKSEKQESLFTGSKRVYVKSLTDESLITLAISFVQTLVYLWNKVFVCVNRTPDPDFSKSAAANSESVSI